MRRFSEIDFTKTWTELERDGETEEMVTSMSNPSCPQALIIPNID